MAVTANLHQPRTVVADHGTLSWWLSIRDDQYSLIDIFFTDQEHLHAFAIAVLNAVAKPETVVDIMPKEEQ